MLRHQRTDLGSVNWPSLLDAVAKNLVDQDLDGWFRPIPGPSILLKKRNVAHDLLFEDEDYFVALPVPPLAAAPAPGVAATPVPPVAAAPGGAVQTAGNCLADGQPPTASNRSLGSAALAADTSAPEDSTPAMSFLMNTARRSLDQVFASANDEKAVKPKENKKKKKEEKDGTSSPSEESSSAEKSDLELDDCASLFGLVKKDLTRPSTAVRLDDLSCRQLGFVMANVLEAVEGLLIDRACTAKRNKHGAEHNSALFEAKTAATVWKKRLASLLSTRSLFLRKNKDSRATFAEKIEQTMVRLREADCFQNQEASEDLKKCLGKPGKAKATAEPKSAKKKRRKSEKKPEGPPKKKAKLVVPKEESDDDNDKTERTEKKDKDKDGDGDGELLDPHVPTPPSDAFSSPEPEPEDDDEQASQPDSEMIDNDDAEDEEDGDDDDDEDIFTGPYKVLQKAPSKEQLLNALPPKLAAQKSKLDDDLLKTIPQTVSQADFDNWIAVLLKEDMLSLKDVQACSGMEGPLSSHLSVSKSFYNKISIKGKQLFDTWVDSLRYPAEARVSTYGWFAVSLQPTPIDPCRPGHPSIHADRSPPSKCQVVFDVVAS
ncbi:unnamed protein product [Symbiodinium sp. CCMP2592]|nr:unnamed protein product [Symbiodinium sp. CCMP2592]